MGQDAIPRPIANRPLLVPEVPHPGEHHRQPQPVRRRDHFIIAHRSARLNHRCNPVFRGFLQAIGKGKKASDASTVPFNGSIAFIAPTFTESTRLICPAPTLTAAPPRVDNGVGLHVLADLPGELERAPFLSVGSARSSPASPERQPMRVGGLHQISAGDRLHDRSRRRGRHSQQPDILLCASAAQRLRRVIGRGDRSMNVFAISAAVSPSMCD